MLRNGVKREEKRECESQELKRDDPCSGLAPRWLLVVHVGEAPAGQPPLEAWREGMKAASHLPCTLRELCQP